MKAVVAVTLCVLAAVLAVVLAVPAPQSKQPLQAQIPGKFVITHYAKPEGPVDHCANCVEWAENAMEDLVQALFDLTFDACQDLCNQLPGQGEAMICNVLCDVVGVKEFINFINKADLDPIYFCQLEKKCEYDDNGSGRLTDTNIVPNVGERGSTFAVNVSFIVYNRTGAGEFMNIIYDESGYQANVTTGAVYDYLAPGQYQGYVQFGTQVDPQQEIYWHSGKYKVQTFFCMGECFSRHPHSKNFGFHNSTFTIKNASDDDQADDGI